MPDRYGAIAIPIPAPLAGEAAADRALSLTLSFFMAVLNAHAQTAWSSVAPGVPVVRAVSHGNPKSHGFNEKDLPALYLWRTGSHGLEQWAEDLAVEETTWTLLWVMQPAQQKHQRLRDTFVNGVVKVLRRALFTGRDAVWVADADLADADALKRSVPTATTPRAYQGAELDGAAGGAPLVSPRRVTVSSAAATGAYSTAGPIVFTGLTPAGVLVTESVSLTATNGGELLEGLVVFARVTRVDVPAQLLTTGAFQFGLTADVDAVADGSLLLRHAALMRLRFEKWTAKPLAIEIPGAEGERSIIKTYEAIEVELSAQEEFSEDLAEAYYPHEATDIDITRGDGTLVEQAHFPDNGDA